MNQFRVKRKRGGGFKHGYYHHPLYRCWWNMRQRCFKKYCKKYPLYGARGITVCDEWSDPKVFVEWGLLNGWARGLQIDRRDNDGNYTPSNCRFVTASQNMKNQRYQGTTGYRGVSKRGDKFRAYCKYDGSQKHLGYFDTGAEAALAYNEFVINNNTGNLLNESI